MKSSTYLKLAAVISILGLSSCDKLPSLAKIASGGGSETAAPTFGCSDPLYAQQWHLTNSGQSGGVPGEDANVKPAWDSGITGKGVRIAVVDDGLEIGHEDLAPNVVSGSYDYLYGDGDPTDEPIDDYFYGMDGHGTAVAGVAAAKGSSGKGGCGAAPCSLRAS